jgi:predicted anti-sigma-YlaC factor YlaD
MGQCLDLETTEDYLEHNLSPEVCARIESHLAECRHCRRMIANIIKSEAVIPDPPIPNKKPKRKQYSKL